MRINFFCSAKFVDDVKQFINNSSNTLIELEANTKISRATWSRITTGNLKEITMSMFVNICTQINELPSKYFTYV
ncbi:hypothetical protein ACFS6H_16465 [Terrimonas rubra]|uniref:Cro/C1-type HTH DNA-binding domain-containing protein n=1 Tax=Terrimonas rubra TaxID=1035890 RepID=A0ABW6A7T3_9BACT